MIKRREGILIGAQFLVSIAVGVVASFWVSGEGNTYTAQAEFLLLAAIGIVSTVNPKLLDVPYVRLLIPFLAFIGGLALWPHGVQGDAFFETVALILPVLILALIIDMGREFQTTMDITDRILLVSSTFLLVTSLNFALRAIAFKVATFNAAQLAAASMATATSFLIISVIRRTATLPENNGRAKSSSDETAADSAPPADDHRLDSSAAPN